MPCVLTTGELLAAGLLPHADDLVNSTIELTLGVGAAHARDAEHALL